LQLLLYQSQGNYDSHGDEKHANDPDHPHIGRRLHPTLGGNFFEPTWVPFNRLDCVTLYFSRLGNAEDTSDEIYQADKNFYPIVHTQFTLWV
jgi:hypothetical protein